MRIRRINSFHLFSIFCSGLYVILLTSLFQRTIVFKSNAAGQITCPVGTVRQRVCNQVLQPNGSYKRVCEFKCIAVSPTLTPVPSGLPTPTVVMATVTPTISPYICGNGVLETGEQCDLNDFGGKTCSTFGYSGGTLSCTAGCTISTSGCLTTSLPEKITLDIGQTWGLVRHIASGFIGADFTNSLPSSSMFLPLKPRLLSWVNNFNSVVRATQNNIPYEFKLWKMEMIPSDPVNGDWSKWESYVRGIANQVKTNNYSTVRFDIWNEPEWPTYWSGSIDERYFQMWKRAHVQIKSVDPNFIVVGPSSNSYSWVKNTFLPRVKADNVLPDVLSWHEINNDLNNVGSRVQSMRSYLSANSMAISEISINEYNTSSTHLIPGKIVKYIYEFEKSKVDYAARACWEEVSGGTYDCAPHMDGTLTVTGQQPRASWWVYRKYADMSGQWLNTYGSLNFTVLASRDDTLGKVSILIANMAGSYPLEVNLTNINPSLINNGMTRISVVEIPNSGTSVLSYPINKLDLVLPVTGGGAKFTIPNTLVNYVYFVTITP